MFFFCLIFDAALRVAASDWWTENFLDVFSTDHSLLKSRNVTTLGLNRTDALWEMESLCQSSSNDQMGLTVSVFALSGKVRQN